MEGVVMHAALCFSITVSSVWFWRLPVYVDGLGAIGSINSPPWATLSTPNGLIAPKDEHRHVHGAHHETVLAGIE